MNTVWIMGAGVDAQRWIASVLQEAKPSYAIFMVIVVK
jgi:hypothetical protein